MFVHLFIVRFFSSVSFDFFFSHVTIATSIQSISGLFVTFAVIAILSVGLICWTKRQGLKDRFKLRTDRKIAFQQQELVTMSLDTSPKLELRLSAISHL